VAVARSNLHESATSMLGCLDRAAVDGRFEGKLRTVQAEAGLSSGRSAEAVKLLEDLGRIEVEQRGRRSRDTIIAVKSAEPIAPEEVQAVAPSKPPTRTRINYEDIGRSVIDRLIELARDDALRSAQVEAFASESERARTRIAELEEDLEEANERETDLRIRLRSAEEALQRAEDNLRRAFNSRPGGDQGDGSLPDEDARAVLDILRGRV
jgi:hypothetical protein